MARTVRGSESTRIGRASPPLMLVPGLAIAGSGETGATGLESATSGGAGAEAVTRVSACRLWMRFTRA
jgi:hypothetical protein